MSMLDSFFNKRFNGAKCKTLLKLTIPRIKLLRNRREIQIKQMRRDIAKLLETGQEATARIRVEHIIREENMMAAQEIIELFCELMAVRLPIIETQRECPLDLKEAISSVCFAAPRCADLQELQQVQMLFASKYGKEFVAAATELMPDCGVNREIIELLSIRTPPAELKMKLLKEIAEEHELDWDPAASETEFYKPHEDLLNGPTQFVSGSKLPLPKEKHDESLYFGPAQAPNEQFDSDTDFDQLDFPEVPKVSLRPSPDAASAPEMVSPAFTASLDPALDQKLAKDSGDKKNQSSVPYLDPEEVVPETLVASSYESSNISVGAKEEKQFVPFVSPPQFSASISTRQSDPAPPVSRTKSDAHMDLQDVLAAAHAAADSAECAAAAARSAASLAQVRITKLVKKRNDNEVSESNEQSVHTNVPNQSASSEMSQLDRRNTLGDADGASDSLDPLPDHRSHQGSEMPNPSCDTPKEGIESQHSGAENFERQDSTLRHQPERLTSIEDDPYFSYPNLFTSQDTNLLSGIHSSAGSFRSTQDH